MNINIKLSPSHIANSTKLSIAETIIHEMIHAYFYYRSIEANGDSLKEQILANELGFLKPYNPNLPPSTFGNQHEQMAASYIQEISNSLKEYKLISNSDLHEIQNIFPSITTETYYQALAWAGLNGDINGFITKAWEVFESNNPSTAQMYSVIISAEENATNLAASHEKCN